MLEARKGTVLLREDFLTQPSNKKLHGSFKKAFLFASRNGSDSFRRSSYRAFKWGL